MSEEELEKEAEEMAEEYLQSIEGDDCVIITDREERKQDFLAGLKAGRPQWHYVKDELPKITETAYWSNDLIFLTKDCSRNITKHFGYFNFRKEFKEYNTEDRFTPDKVIAWKEIVLPKESE